MKAKGIEVEHVTKEKPMRGVYFGIWRGYEVVVEGNFVGTFWRIKTDNGIRGSAEVRVEIGDEINIEKIS